MPHRHVELLLTSDECALIAISASSALVPAWLPDENVALPSLEPVCFPCHASDSDACSGGIESESPEAAVDAPRLRRFADHGMPTRGTQARDQGNASPVIHSGISRGRISSRSLLGASCTRTSTGYSTVVWRSVQSRTFRTVEYSIELYQVALVQHDHGHDTHT